MLKAGRAHRLKVQYLQLGAKDFVTLEWRGSNSTRSVWIPPGKWICAWNGEFVDGPATVIATTPLDETPLYIRSGSIFALAPEMQYTGQSPWDPVTLDVYPSTTEKDQTTLYEDDTLTTSYEHGHYRNTPITAWANDVSKTLSVSIGAATGSFSGASTQRSWIVRLRRPANWPANFAPTKVILNGLVTGQIIRRVKNTTAMPLGADNGSPDADVLYLVNRDSMGGLSSGNADTNVLQTWSLNSGEIHGAPVWWSCTTGPFLYIWPASKDHLRQYQFTNGLFNTNVYSESASVGGSGSPGGILSVSADGANAGTGIVWATVNTTSSANQAAVAGTLHAYSAENVTNELWNSDMVPGRDSLGNLAKFVPPTVANGKVYVATFSGRVDVYGLFAPPALTISMAQQQTTISWPTNAHLNFILQSSTNLSSGYWVDITNIPVATNGTNQVTVPATVPAVFYRLTL
jgi:hypothetical protein